MINKLKNLFLLLLCVAAFGGASGSAQTTASRAKIAAKTAEISFVNLADFINDERKRKRGERFVVSGVPTAKIENVADAVEATGNPAHRGLFALDFTEGADGSGTFLTTKTLARNVQANGNSKAATLRVTAVLVETAGDVDVYRSVFVTKIEGLDKKGKSVWTAAGDLPAKVRFGF